MSSVTICTSIALVNILVSRNGIFSGNFSLVIATYKAKQNTRKHVHDCETVHIENTRKIQESPEDPYLKTVSKINMKDFSTQAIQHQVRWMPGTENGCC